MLPSPPAPLVIIEYGWRSDCVDGHLRRHDVDKLITRDKAGVDIVWLRAMVRLSDPTFLSPCPH